MRGATPTSDCLFVCLKRKVDQMSDLNIINVAPARSAVTLPSYVMLNEEKQALKQNVKFAEDDDGNTFVNLGWLPIRPGNRGKTGRSCGLLSINEWDRDKKEAKDMILCDADAITGTPSFIALSVNMAAIAKKGHTFPDFATGEVKQGSLFNGEPDGVGATEGGDVAPVSDEDRKSMGIID